MDFHADLVLYSAMLFLSFSPVRLSRISEICINLGNTREARNRKFSITGPAGINREGRIPVPFTIASRAERIPSEDDRRCGREETAGARSNVEDAFYGE